MTALLNTRVLLSLGIIVAVAAALISATGAFFSDTETSTGNTFAAGTLNLTLSDWDGTNTSTHAPFNITGMMPGDQGEKMLHIVSTADAWGKIVLAAASRTNPGEEGTGNLWDELLFTIDASVDGTNWTNVVTDEVYPTTGFTIYTADVGGQYLDANQPYYVRISYNLPTTTGNNAQGDSMTFDASITAYQYQNNTDPSQNNTGNGNW